MRVSIVITNYNYERFLREAIESALGQFHDDVEVVVVDDGSTDDSAGIIHTYRQRVVPLLKAHAGQGAAVNAGFAAATGDIVIFLDPDDLLLPGAAEQVVGRFLTEPHLAKVHWPMLLADASGEATGELYPSQPLDEGNLRDRLWVCPRYITPPQSGNAYARWCLDAILPMPEEPFPAGADCYLYHLVIPFGEIGTLPEPQSLYRKHGSSVSAQPQYARMARWAHLDDAAWKSLATECRRLGLPNSLEHWQRNSWNHRFVRAVGDIGAHISPEEPFVLIDDNGSLGMPPDDRLIQWWGLPDDGAGACNALEEYRTGGARFAVMAWPAFWWLAYYGELRRHLSSQYALIASNERVRIYDLHRADDRSRPGIHRPSAPRNRSSRREERVPVVMCTYQRPDRLPETLAMLEEQEACRAELHIWNNNPEIAESVTDAVSAAPRLDAVVHQSERNVGGFGRFRVAAGLKHQARVVFIDDDVELGPNTLSTLLREFVQGTVHSFHAFRFTSSDDYFSRVECRPGQPADYCGTGGMICGTEIFSDPALARCPARFRFVEDLWLSYFASVHYGWRLFRSEAPFHLRLDGCDQWRGLGNLKSEFLRHLVSRGWRVGERPLWGTPSPPSPLDVP